MGILDFLFKSKPPPEEPTWEIVEKQLSVDHQKYQVRIKKAAGNSTPRTSSKRRKLPRISPLAGFSCSMKTRPNRTLPPL